MTSWPNSGNFRLVREHISAWLASVKEFIDGNKEACKKFFNIIGIVLSYIFTAVFAIAVGFVIMFVVGFLLGFFIYPQYSIFTTVGDIANLGLTFGIIGGVIALIYAVRTADFRD